MDEWIYVVLSFSVGEVVEVTPEVRSDVIEIYWALLISSAENRIT
jgi:hypothetical protein